MDRERCIPEYVEVIGANCSKKMRGKRKDENEKEKDNGKKTRKIHDKKYSIKRNKMKKIKNRMKLHLNMIR